VSMLFVRPGHLHRASAVLSASSEDGLTVAPATATSTNAGALRVRTSGRPTAARTLDVKLQTGGNPSGYALTTGSGQGQGAAAIWKKTSDSTSSYRGYVDTPYLVRIDYPVAYGTGLGKPSTPRELANGNLGFVIDHCPGTASSFKFCYVTTANVATTVDIDAATNNTGNQSDFVVLPSGRLVVVRVAGSALTRFSSEDSGLTWTAAVPCGQVSSLDIVCLEYVDDVLVMVLSSATGATATEVRVSQDEGYNWTTVDDTQTLRGVRTCVTTTGKILAISVASPPEVREIAPGGGLSTSTVDPDITCNTGRVAIVTRDDGTVWAFCTNSTAGSHLDLDCSVSLDGGRTFTTPLASGRKVWNANSTILNAGHVGISAGSWAGRIVVLGLSRSSGAVGSSDYAIHMYTIGNWESVTEGSPGGTVFTYDHCLIPVDLPDQIITPWTRVNTGAGATVTNQGPLSFTSTGANASYFLAPTAVLAATNPGGTYRVRYRARQVSGGTIASISNGIRFTIADGSGNHQGFILRMSTTQFQLVEADGTTSISTKTLDMTNVTDFLFAFKHDNVANVSGLLSYWYKQDADETWTIGGAALAIGEHVVAGNSQLRVGGSSAVVGVHDCYYVGVADSSDGMEGGFTNPDDLTGRPLGATDYYVTAGLHMGGFNAGGVPGDAYTVGTTYSYGKEAIWRELRPSRKCHSAADNTSWNVVFDAGSTNLFKGDVAAVFGTNMRTCSVQLNATDSWGAPSVSIALDATLVTSTVGAGVRGPGYLGPTTSLNWRPGQFKSDGDGHRFFLSVGGVVYEITDNDEARIYVDGADFSASAGTFYIFGDKMCTSTTFAQSRYMRLLVGAQETSDGVYHVGVVIFDKKYTPTQTFDAGHVERIEPRVEWMETDAGYRSRARLGPRLDTLAIQWSPIDYLGATLDTEWRLRDFYASLEGAPFLFWFDTTDIASVGLYTLEGIYQASNVLGERKTALTRVDQIVMRPVL
jgi:hypothetical protein